MASSRSLFTLANRLRAATQARIRIQLPILQSLSSTHPYCTQARGPPGPSLAKTILPLGHPSISIVPELDRWVHLGNKVRKVELQNLVRDLRRRRRYKQALEVRLFALPAMCL